ncbi:MAG: ABC transporter permease [Actinomycetota bacterium]
MSTKEPIQWNQAFKEIVSGSLTRTILSVLLGFLVGAIFMVISSKEFFQAIGYFFADPGATFRAAWDVIVNGYGALIKGSIYNPDAKTFEGAIRPLTESLRLAGPLIAAGLGIGLGFRVGLFNIGGTGQMVSGLIWATFVATRMELPPIIHFVVAVIAAIIGSTIMGAFVGYLKAKTGANEVITTIMLNYVTINFFAFLLLDNNLLQGATASGNTKSDPAFETARLPLLFGEGFSLHFGFVLALIAVVVYWWLMERSTVGFRLRAVGFNPSAARTAGIKVEATYILALGLSAAFVGIAAANQALSSTGGVTPTSHSGIGFDAITVALLGGSTAPGVLLAGLLFGAFRAGGASIQAAGISPDVLGIIQGAIVLFIAAPPLVRAIFRLPPSQTTSVLASIRSKLSRRGASK